ncbi:MAG: hypothetical protein Q7S98_03845 [Deltaproteobacteria bacterium]|nr:hypothetical protein [Deltaproteobacteria bacterium]
MESNIFKGEVVLSCQGCRRKLAAFPIKDWYEQYIQSPESVVTSSASPASPERKIDLE